jgi:hypothetical protein
VWPSVGDLTVNERPDVVCVLREATRSAVAQPESDGYFVWLTKSRFRSLFSSKIPVAIWNVYPTDTYVLPCRSIRVMPSISLWLTTLIVYRSGVASGSFIVTQMPANDSDRTHLSCLALPTTTPDGSGEPDGGISEAALEAAFECVIVCTECSIGCYRYYDSLAHSHTHTLSLSHWPGRYLRERICTCCNAQARRAAQVAIDSSAWIG